MQTLIDKTKSLVESFEKI